MIAPLLKGLLLGFLLSISIGPVIFAILKQSLTNGRKAGYVFVAGVSASDIGLFNIFITRNHLVLLFPPQEIQSHLTLYPNISK